MYVGCQSSCNEYSADIGLRKYRKKSKLEKKYRVTVLTQIVVQSLNHVQLSETPWTAASQASLFTISQSLLKLMSVELVMPSNHFVPCHPLLLLPSIFLIISIFSSELALCIKWPKYWSFSFSISPSDEYSGLISFRIDWFDLLAVLGLLRVFLSPTVQKHQFFGAQPSLWSNSHSIHDYWKNHSFDYIGPDSLAIKTNPCIWYFSSAILHEVWLFFFFFEWVPEGRCTGVTSVSFSGVSKGDFRQILLGNGIHCWTAN